MLDAIELELNVRTTLLPRVVREQQERSVDELRLGEVFGPNVFDKVIVEHPGFVTVDDQYVFVIGTSFDLTRVVLLRNAFDEDVTECLLGKRIPRN